MHPVVYILFGVLWTAATSWALGALLLRTLGVAFYRGEERLLASMAGSAILSAIVFLLCTLKLARKGVFLILGALALAAAIRAGARRPRSPEFAPLPRFWKCVFIAVFAAFSYVYLFNAMSPEMSPDGMAYHLATVAKYQRAHGFVRITTNFYSNLSEGAELLFLYAFVFGRHSSAALVHYAFLAGLSLMMLAYGRRIGHPRAGVAGALFVYASPIVGRDATVAYIDVALAAVLFALFYFLQIWLEQPHPLLAIPIGMLAGFGYAVKYTAFLAVPYALGLVVWKSRRGARPALRPALLAALFAFAFVAPWMIKNWVWMDDPVSPFLTRAFPNPYVHVSFEDDWRKYQRLYGVASYWQLPLQLTVKGDLITGLFGPLFLLTPLALLSLRFRAGRQLLLAGAVFALPYYANIGTRFLIPAAPFIALALALAFANVGWLLLTLVVAHAISCWPRIVDLYCGQYTWRLYQIPVRAALRIEPEDAYLTRNSLEYNIARMLEKTVPAGQRVFAFSQTGESYTSREVLSRYTAALNEKIGDMLWTPLFDGMQPTRILRLQFPARAARAIRVIQTAKCNEAMWSVAELRVFRSGRELPRAPSWRLLARPNPWDVQMAFDNSIVSRWRSWQVAQPGMYVQVDFGQPETIDTVVVESSGEDRETRLKLEGMDAGGAWSAITDQAQESTRPIAQSLRWEAAQNVKALGIRYVLALPDDLRASDYSRYTPLWGMKCVGQAGPARLYYIE